MKPGGRFVGEMGGAGNIACIAGALAAALGRRGLTAELPWQFPSAAEYRARLDSAGFAVGEITLFPRPTPLPGDIAAWLDIFAGALLTRLPADQRPDFIAELRDALRPRLHRPDGSWVVDYVRLRFGAVKPR